MPTIHITTGSDLPIFRQIVQQVRGGIAAGSIGVGEALPSVRALASELVVNHNTVAKAYAQLVRDGLIESQQGRGYFVTQQRDIYTKAERIRRVKTLLEPMISEAITLGFAPDEVAEMVRKELAKVSKTKRTKHGK